MRSAVVVPQAKGSAMNSTLKIVGIVLGVMLLVGGCGLVSCLVCAGGLLGGAAEVASGVSESVAEGERLEREAAARAVALGDAALPWLAAVRENCRRYEAAPNEIQMSAIFQENETFVEAQALEGVVGVLSSLSTAHGGGGLVLSIDVGDAHFVDGGIEENNPLYTQASGLLVHGCVVISGELTGTAIRFERERVCERHFMIRLSSIGACPGAAP